MNNLKKKVYFPAGRREWNDLINAALKDITFINPQISGVGASPLTQLYSHVKKERASLVHKLLSRVMDIPCFLIPTPLAKGVYNYDFLISLESFLLTTKPYFVYAENVHGILNLRTYKDSALIERQIRYYTSRPNFKGFIFFSKFSETVFRRRYSNIIDFTQLFTNVIYPFVPDMDFDSSELLEYRLQTIDKEVRLLYISSSFYLKGGGELLEAFKEVSKDMNVHLTIVTNPRSISDKDTEYIEGNNGVEVLPGNKTFLELKELYRRSHILVHPTYMDSTAVVVLEAIKAMLPVIATRTFAIPEYVKHGYNGILLGNPFDAYTEDGAVINADILLSKPGKNFITSICRKRRMENVVVLLAGAIKEVVGNYDIFLRNAKSNYSDDSCFREARMLDAWNDSIIRFL